jgi:hypothetical protein
MKLSPDVEFHEDVRLFVWRPRGLLNETSVNKVIGVLEGFETKLQEPFNRFSDTSETDQVELNYRYVIEISLHRVLFYGDRAPVKSAILATDSTIAHYFQLHAIITEDSPIHIRIFQEREEAARWLGVPLHRLAPRSACAKDDSENDQRTGNRVAGEVPVLFLLFPVIIRSD